MTSPTSTEPLPLTFKRVLQVAQSPAQLRARGITTGKSTGWKALDPYYTVCPGQLCVVTGIPGSGKSEWLDNLAMHLAMRYEMGFAVFSPENYPLELHIQKLTEKYIGKAFLSCTDEEIDKALRFLNERFYFIAHTESPTLAQIVDDAAALMLGDKRCRGLILDPWNEVEHVRPAQYSETEYISWALSILRQFARIHDASAWIVAHPTKLQRDKADGKYPVPTLYDISGSAHWRNKADVGIVVHRHDPHINEADVYIQKVRFKHTGRMGRVTLQYHYESGRFF